MESNVFEQIANRYDTEDRWEEVHSGFSHEKLNNILSDVGFHSIEIKTFHHGEKIFMKQDASMFISSSIK